MNNYDQMELTSVRDKYAKQNVEVNYFNATDLFSYRTYNNDLLSCLEELSLSESIKVFPSQEEKDKLIGRAPFINNFTFIQASDYDVVKVEAVHTETEETYELKFGVPVDNQLSLSGRYVITETNSYGKTREYEATFLNKCLTQMMWTIIKDGKESKLEITADSMVDNNPVIIEADSAFITEIFNEYDEGAIVTVKAPGVYSFEIKCLASEFVNLEFYKAGEYEISFIDRIGNSYKVILRITGDIEYGDMQTYTASYTSFYNSLYLNPKDDIEDFYELSDIVVEESVPSEGEENEIEITVNNTEVQLDKNTIGKIALFIMSSLFIGIFCIVVWRIKRKRQHTNDEKAVKYDGKN